jgi:hypothetical protein
LRFLGYLLHSQQPKEFAGVQFIHPNPPDSQSFIVLEIMATINDLVLVYLEHKPAFYARINDINPDVKRGWYQVELLVLTLPPQNLVWIIEADHLEGQEFTMGGSAVKLVLVPPKPAAPSASPTPTPGKAKVIPLARKP